MVNSMTGFASASGAGHGYRWAWEMRSVNARGLDIRLRVPDWISGLEAAVRGAITSNVKRGNISLSLRVSRDQTEESIALDEGALAAALTAIHRIETAAAHAGVSLAPTSAADILAVKGVANAAATEEDTTPLLKALVADLPDLIDAFNDMRAGEGAGLAAVLHDQLGQVESLVSDASEAAEDRADQMADTLRTNLARVLANSDGADPDRVAQELALIAVKSDIREELDRLEVHVAAARDLIRSDGAMGRKLDFLMQEFNREANTLCSKAQSSALTAIGLDLKAVIDQMREQVQNVE